MKIFDKIRYNSRKLIKLTIVTVAALGFVTGLGFGVKHAVAEFYPNRTPFDYSKPCNPNDNDIYDRCGSMTGPVFNSFINTPSYGDERAFVDARRSDQTASGSYKNVLNNVHEGSKEIVVRMYVHNNANQSTNESGLGIARNTKVRVAVPSAESSALRARGYITADNAATVEDTVDFTAGGQQFSVEYVPGSATLFDNDNFKSGVKLADSIVTTGAPIGSDALDGNLKGCFEYEAVVQIKLKVTTKKNPKVDFTKQVRIKGEKDWKEVVTTKPGQEVEWLLTTQNTGQAVLNNIVVRDVLPPHVQLTRGSVKWIDASQNAGQNDKPLFDGGINVGNYAPGSGFYMMFATKVKGDLPEGKCEVRVRNLAYVKSTQTPDESKDSADVIIKKDGCKPPKPTKPQYDCKLLTLKELGGRKIRVSVTPTMSEGVTVKHYVYDFGDGSTPLVTDKNTVEYTYAKDGNFVTRVKIAFNVDGAVKVVDSDVCAAPVTFKTPGQPEVKGDQTPTVLPATGPAELVGVFVSTTVAGMIAYNVVYRRFYS